MNHVQPTLPCTSMLCSEMLSAFRSALKYISTMWPLSSMLHYIQQDAHLHDFSSTREHWPSCLRKCSGFLLSSCPLVTVKGIPSFGKSAVLFPIETVKSSKKPAALQYYKVSHPLLWKQMCFWMNRMACMPYGSFRNISLRCCNKPTKTQMGPIQSHSSFIRQWLHNPTKKSLGRNHITSALHLADHCH